MKRTKRLHEVRVCACVCMCVVLLACDCGAARRVPRETSFVTSDQVCLNL